MEGQGLELTARGLAFNALVKCVGFRVEGLALRPCLMRAPPKEA